MPQLDIYLLCNISLSVLLVFLYLLRNNILNICWKLYLCITLRYKYIINWKQKIYKFINEYKKLKIIKKLMEKIKKYKKYIITNIKKVIKFQNNIYYIKKK